MKYFLFFTIFIFGLFFTPSLTLAADTNVDCGLTPGTCSITSLDPLFSPTDGLWFPGRTLSKTINLQNSSDSTQTMSLRATRSPLSILVPSPLEDNNILNISITDSSPSLIWSGDLSDFYSAGEIGLGIFDLGINADYTIIISMNVAADNSYQNKESKFDLALGFTTDVSPPSDGDGGDGGGIGGDGGGDSICTSPVPDIPTGLSAESISSTQVLLSWSHVSPPLTSYLVAFGPAVGDYRWGNPNVGSGDSYVVGSLTPGAQYCFYVRAQNGCMPGLASAPVCINTGSIIPISETPPPGFEEGILGEQTTATSGSELGQTEGIQTCARYWLPLLFLLAFFINLFYYYHQIEKDRQTESRFKHTLPFFLSISTYFIDKLILKDSCCLIAPLFCQYFWLGNIFSWLIPRYYYHKQSK